MRISVDGAVELLGHEGLATKPYLDSVGVKTIGGGSTVSDITDLPNWSWDKELTIPEVVSYFQNGLKKYEATVNKALQVFVSQTQFDALVSICYNIGEGGTERSTFMRRINSNSFIENFLMMFKDEDLSQLSYLHRTDRSIQYEESEEPEGFNTGSVVSAIMMWDKPIEIIGRRRKEAKLFSTGQYSNGGKALLFPVNSITHKPMYSKGKEIDVRSILMGDNAPSIPTSPKQTPAPVTQVTQPSIWDVLAEVFKKIWNRK